MNPMQSYGPPLIALLAFGCLGGPVLAEDTASDADKGRYTMTTTPDGVIRLDTRTGSVSTCSNSAGSGWACYAIPDERAALDAEIGRLQDENEKLKVQLASRDHSVTGKIDEPLPKDQALPKSDQLKKAEPKSGESKPGESKPGESKSAEGTRKLEIPLPSDQDMDRMMGFLEQAWRRLLDMAGRVQKDVSGKI
ncbi:MULTISPECIES: hypothetical protein [unclassified Bradyrhizobium]|uniref:hypothetical protein n=1 Tax=unclassified Bradyrhizobium TaxID=2631580 RepID=UPI0028EF764C|nr:MULTISPECIES: hypothetical protein [unclassified Bradyrhizobium]